MPDHSGIDPRYAAQFQRGFDPATDAPATDAPSARSGSVRTGAPPPAPSIPGPPRETAALQPGEAADVAPPMPSDEQTTPDEEAAPGEQPGPRTTWWDWLLPVFGTVLVATALVLWWGLATDSATFFGTSDTDPWPAFLQLARYELPGPLLIAGMTAITAGVALRATKSRR